VSCKLRKAQKKYKIKEPQALERALARAQELVPVSGGAGCAMVQTLQRR